MNLVILDFETTGLDPKTSEILEVGAVKLQVDPDTRVWKIDKQLSFLIKPERGPIPREIVEITKITDEMVADKPHWKDCWKDLADFIGHDPIIAHHAKLESAFLEEHLSPKAGGLHYEVYNSIEAFAFALPEFPSHSLESIRGYAGIKTENAHRALQDVLDVERGLQWLRHEVLAKRPYLSEITQSALSNWWWSWLFLGDGPILHRTRSERLKKLQEWIQIPFQGTLKNQEDVFTQSQFNTVSKDDIEKAFQASKRPSQIEMSWTIAEALREHKKVAIEAPTGTGKSLGYLIPAMLSQPSSQDPIVIATHTRALQDQLLTKDVPLASEKVAKNLGPFGVPATQFLKGQNNYPCLRKLSHQLEETMSFAESDPSRAAQERVFSYALLLSYLCAQRLAEPSRAKSADLSRLSSYLQYEIPNMEEAVESVTSMKSTTIGEKCPYFKSCHFYGAYREAGQSAILVTNHALLVRWPDLIKKPRHMIFDEAHHLERELTETLTHEINEESIYRILNQLQKDAPIYLKEISLKDKILQLIPSAQGALKEIHLWCQRLVPQGRDHFVVTEAQKDAVLMLKTALEKPLREIYTELSRFKSAPDTTLAALERMEYVLESLQVLDRLTVSESFKKDLRTFHWNVRERTFSLKIEPILLEDAGHELFQNVETVIFTTATFEKTRQEVPLFKRLGLKDVKFVTLPSPFSLEKQAQVWIPRDFPPPNSQLHLDRLIDLTAEVASITEGRTLLLMAARSRIDYAVPRLSERLSPKGIKVLNGTRDRLAQERFRENPKALLVGSEAYGEGLDLPGNQLVVLILEKINEAMVRGPLHDARRNLYKNGLFEYDFPKRMNWLKQRMGRLIRTPEDQGVILLLDSRYYSWSQASQEVVRSTVFPMPLKDFSIPEIPLEIHKLGL